MERMISLLAICLLLSSCNKPVRNTGYTRLGDGGFAEEAEFMLEMVKSGSPQQIIICMQLNNSNISRYDRIGTVLTAISPEQVHYTDTLQLPLKLAEREKMVRKENGAVTIEWPYRRGVMIEEDGEWIFRIKPAEESGNEVCKEIIGIGISYKNDTGE